jgi:hypothetical protein
VPDDLHHRLEVLAQLRGGDRKAVLQRLSAEERRLLDALRTLAPSPRPTAPIAPTKKTIPPCSPWLAKRLAQLLDEKAGQDLVTMHARDALLIVVAGERRLP